jgi:hypothetical protein
MTSPVCATEPRRTPKNTEFRIILKMGLREAYSRRTVAVLACGVLEDIHMKYPAALGPNRG